MKLRVKVTALLFSLITLFHSGASHAESDQFSPYVDKAGNISLPADISYKYGTFGVLVCA